MLAAPGLASGSYDSWVGRNFYIFPAGVFYFVSTNKFRIRRSGEFNFPLYGWLPNKWRYHLRVKSQGPDIMKLGIDFNQFTYWGLRRFFRKVGFSKVYDLVDLREPQQLMRQNVVRCSALKILKKVPLLKHAVLPFVSVTHFICIK